MATHAQILYSLMEELDCFEHRVGLLLKSNREQIRRAGECLADSKAQQAEDRPHRNNRSFLRR